MKRTLLAAIITAVALSVVMVSVSAKEDFAIGTKLEGFKLPDPNGKEHNFDDLKGENGALVIFLSAQCPVVQQYNDRINAIAEAYKSKGINFIGIYPNVTESDEWIKEHSEANYKFPVLIDRGHAIADQFNATRTPEVYFFNQANVLDYWGAIDNDRSGRNITKQFLTTAFNQKLGGKEITEKETRAFGCSIKRKKKEKS